MIAFLKGVVAAKFAQKAYLDVSGVGFEIFMSLSSYDFDLYAGAR